MQVHLEESTCDINTSAFWKNQPSDINASVWKNHPSDINASAFGRIIHPSDINASVFW
jgi:hypothetical protein